MYDIYAYIDPSGTTPVGRETRQSDMAVPDGGRLWDI